MMDCQIHDMSSSKRGHARSCHYWESLPGTMTGNSWDYIIQGTVYEFKKYTLAFVIVK